MDEHDVQYGLLGQLLYNPTDKSWLARRAFASSYSYALQPLTPSQWAIKPLPFADASCQPHSTPMPHHGLDKAKPTRRITANLSALTNRLPVIAPVNTLAVSLAHLSEDVTAVTALHDPTYGDLLAFGRVADHATKRTFSVAAFPARDSAALLCLTQVQPQKQGWEQNKTVWIEVPRIAGEAATWDSTHPIRQLAFCPPPHDPEGLTPYLAVRTSVAVHILRLNLRKPSSSRNTAQHLPNRFRISPTFSLHLDLLRGISPAHVAFNPSYEKQLATIDQTGTWRIWDLSRQTAGHHGIALEIASGATASSSVPHVFAEPRVLDDGWGRIAWAANSSTIISVTRTSVGIYDISSKPLRLVSPHLSLNNTPHWILDMHTSPADHALVFILTSVHLMCLRIHPVVDSLDNHDTAGAHVLFQTCHYRDPEDISLRLSIFLDAEDTVILIKSSLSLLATSYRCSAMETSTAPFISVSDPALLHLPEDPSGGRLSSLSLGLHVHTARYSEGYNGASGPGETYRDSAIRFYMMTRLSNDMSIVEKLYCAQPYPHGLEILPVDWHSRLTGGAVRLQSRRFVVDDDDMIQDVVKQPRSNARVLPVKPSAAQIRKDWTVIYENAYNRIAKAERTEGQDFSNVLETIWSNLDSQDDAQRDGIKTLFDLCDSQVSVGDIDETAAQFRNLLLESKDRRTVPGDNATQLIPTGLALASVLGLPDSLDHRHDPMIIYDNVINHWLAPLSQRVPGRVRLAKEQLARRVAAEVCLASCGLKRPELDDPQDDNQELVESSATQSSAFLGSSQSQGAFPTPSPTATPSLATATSLSSHPSTLASREYIRLKQYVTFGQAKPTPAPLPKALASKLDHWTLGGDPDDYDWLSTQRQQEKEAEEENEGLTLKERSRIKKRAERHLRNQRRQAEKAAIQQAASSQAPEVISASQPSLPRRAPPRNDVVGAASQGAALSSSQGVSQSQTQQFPASQIEAGKFGGRPSAKKKKKRNIGF